ncbi:hypothetical protein ACWCQN_43970 [Streptomyces sp. NPDC001984]
MPSPGHGASSGQSSKKVTLIYQHFDDERQWEVAAAPGTAGHPARQEAIAMPQGTLLIQTINIPARIWHATTDHRGQQKGPGL